MSTDPSVIAALEAAIAADPLNPALRVHLATLLVMAGDPGRALEHAEAALAAAPDDTEALLAARDAARALGDEPRSQAYAQRLAGGERVALPATPEAGDEYVEDDFEPRPDVTL